MRRNFRFVPLLALTCLLFAVLAAPASAQRSAKPDLVVESQSGPPDNAIADDSDFLVGFTVGNQGRASARRVTLARAYLSIGRVMSADDRRRRVGDRRVRPLRAGRSQTRRLTVEIPPAFRAGEYFLIVCADVRNVVDETNDRANCNVSGQKIQVVTSAEELQRQGPPGPPGPAGPAGPPGEGGNVVAFPRKVLPLGTATLIGYYNDRTGNFYDAGDDEGSTEMFDLGEVAGVRIRALCRKTDNGEGGHSDAVPTGGTSYNENGDEAKILLYYDRPEGNFSFDGDHGSRRNVAAGFGRDRDTENGEDTEADPLTAGGEGRHMFLGTARDPENTRITGSGVDEPRNDYGTAFRSTSGYVSTSGGGDFHLSVYAGVDVLGAGTSNCVFGGHATVLSG